MYLNKSIIVIFLLLLGIQTPTQTVQPSTIYSSTGTVACIGLAYTCYNLQNKLEIIDRQLHEIDEYIAYIQQLSITQILSIKNKTEQFLKTVNALHKNTKELETLIQSIADLSIGATVGLSIGACGSMIDDCQATAPLCLTGLALTSLVAITSEILTEQKKLSRQELVKTVYGTLLTKIHNETIRHQVLHIIQTCTVKPEMQLCMKQLKHEFTQYTETDLKEYIQQRYNNIKFLVKHAKTSSKAIMQSSIAGAFGCMGWLCWSTFI